MTNLTTSVWRRWKKKRCERLGHRVSQRVSRGYVLPGEGFHYRVVAYQAKRIVTECRRCGEVLSTDIERLGHLNSLGLPSEDWETLERSGEVWNAR